MVDPLTLAAFVPAALALNLTPGADMMFCAAQGLRAGPRGAWAASAGISTGSMVHVLVAGAGLSAFLARWPVTFDVIRWLGVAYLLWLAWQTLRRGPAAPDRAPGQARSALRAFRAGFLVNLTNPKVILFVLAFIPQFVKPDAGPVIGQFAVFGAVLALGGLVINGCVGMSAGVLTQRLVAGSRLLDYLTAGIFTALALRLALPERG